MKCVLLVALTQCRKVMFKIKINEWKYIDTHNRNLNWISWVLVLLGKILKENEKKYKSNEDYEINFIPNYYKGI